MSKLRRKTALAPSGTYGTPRNASGINAMIMIALKIVALKMALCGDESCMMFNACNGPVLAADEFLEPEKAFAVSARLAEAGKAALHAAYIEHIHTLVVGLCYDPRITARVFQLDRTVRSLDDRVNTTLSHLA